MRLELDELLCRRYPELFRDRHGDRQKTSMCWGFACDDGWFALIDVLCAEIMRHGARTGRSVVAVQVKEKLSSLRVHVRGGDDFIAGLCSMALTLSESICEACGAIGPPHAGRPCARCTGLPADKPDANGTGKPDIDAASSDECVAGESRPVLPHISSPGWAHLVTTLAQALGFEALDHDAAPIVIDEVIEDNRLGFRWRGGDALGRVAGMFRLIEAMSERIDPATGASRK